MIERGWPDPLMLDGWLEFNRWKWGLEPLRVKYTARGELPAITGVLYLNKRGKVVLPKLNPYLPLAFEPTPTEKRHRLYHEWLETATLMAQDMSERGLCGPVCLSPRASDARPWRWAGFQVGPSYTYHLDLPMDLDQVDREVERSVRKAQKAGYRIERTTNMSHLLAPLQHTEARQRFRLRLTLQDLEEARRLLGDEHLRVYVCCAASGAPVSGYTALHVARKSAVGWVGGTSTEHLHFGVTQLVLYHMMKDVQASGAVGFDLAGANIPSVAAAKMRWGGSLVSYPTVESYNFRGLARWALGWLRS